MRRHKIKDIVEGITGTLFCLVLFAMFSCTSDRDQYGENLEIIDFGIVQQTRATDSSFENGDKIGIYAVESGQSFQVSGNYADNRQYTYQNGKLSRRMTGSTELRVKAMYTTPIILTSQGLTLAPLLWMQQT